MASVFARAVTNFAEVPQVTGTPVGATVLTLGTVAVAVGLVVRAQPVAVVVGLVVRDTQAQ